MVRFDETPDGRRFVASATERETAEAVLYAIALAAHDGAEAEAIWRSRLLPGRNARASAETIYEVARRNMPVTAAAMRWRGDAAWAVRVENRALAGRAAGRWLGAVRETILEAEGLKLLRVGTSLVAEHANLESGRSGPLWTYVSDAQVALARRGIAAARAVLEELRLVRTLPDDALGIWLAAKGARDRLVDDGEDEADYAVTVIVPTFQDAGVTVQRFDRRGDPAGDPRTFAVAIERGSRSR